MMTIIVLYVFLAIIAVVVILLHFSVNVYLKLDDGFIFKIKYLFFNIYPRKQKPPKPKKASKKTEVKKSELKELNDDIFHDKLDDDFEKIEGQADVQEKIKIDDDVAEKEKEITVSETVKTDDEEISVEVKEKTEIKKKKSKIPKVKKTKKVKTKKEKKQSGLDKLKAKYYKIKPYLPMGWKYFKKLLKAVRITDLKINIDVGREDAHEAAIYYGAVSGTLFNTLGLVGNIFTLKIKKADVNCVFTKNTVDGNGECYVRVRPSTIIAIAVCVAVNFLIIYFKQKKTKKSDIINQEDKVKEKVEVK